MKNLKQSKMQIFAALALAFSLGMMVPSATFASEGSNEEAGIEAQAEGTTTDKKDTLGLAASIAALYNTVQGDNAFSGYQKSIPLIQAVNAYAPFTKDAETVLKGEGGADGQNLWASLDTKTQAKLEGKTGVEAEQILQDSEDDTALATQITAFSNKVNTAQSTLRTQVAALRPTLSNVNTLSGADLVAAAEGLDDYDKYVKLYNSMDFVRAIATPNVELTEAIVKEKLPNETMQMTGYNAMAVAASAIDAKSTEGLYTFTLPDTSKGGDVDAPNTGIVGLIESGALDMGMMTLIVSVAVVSVAGLGLIAKLYLKHKF